MSIREYITQRPFVLRIILGALSLYLVLVALGTFYRFASSPTDENLFTDSPSLLYVVKSIPADFTGKSMIPWKIEGKFQTSDSVRPGDLLWGIDGEHMDGLGELGSYLQGVPNDRVIELGIVHPPLKAVLAYRLKRASFPDSAIIRLTSAVVVTAVTPEGASDRAGMRIGDIIVRINGKEFNGAMEADQVLRRAQSGKAISYEEMRDGKPLTLNVTLAQFGFPLSTLVFSLSGIVLIGIGSFIAMRRPQIKVARLLGLSFMLPGFFMAVSVVRRDVDSSLFTVIRNITMILSLYFGVAFAMDSTAYFPKERPVLLSKRWRSIIIYSLAGALCGAAFIMGYLRILDGLFGVVYLMASLTLMLVFHYTLLIIYRKDRSPEYKRLSRIVKFTGVGVGVLASGFILATRSTEQIGFIGALIILIPLAHLYTIGRYRLLDMNLRVRRNVQYTLVTIFWGVLVGSIFLTVLLNLTTLNFHLPSVAIRGLSIEINEATPSGQERTIQERAVLMGAAILLWYGLWHARRWGQRIIDRKYYRTQYDYRRAATELAEVLATKLTMLELGRGIVEKLTDLMHLKRAGVLFFRGDGVCCCHEALGVDEKPWETLCCQVDKELIGAIGEFAGEFRVDYLPPGKKEIFQQNEFLYLVPIRSKDQLIGTLLLGEKLSEATYSQEDLEFLAAAANQVSVSIENAFLYEELAEKERMKHELAIARQIQLASLPQRTPVIEGLDIAGLSLPAMEVGGDFFDYLNGETRKLTVVVGDVSGKGTSAALYMSKVQGILRSLHDFGLSPAELFVRANRLLCGDLEKKSFVTAIGADFDPQTRRVVLARAGHLPLYWYKAADRTVEKITPRGLGLGLNNAGIFASELEEKTFAYERGDILIFVTDGVTEARNGAGEEFGDDRLLKLMVSDAAHSAERVRDHIVSDIRAFAGDQVQHDDQTIVAVKVLENTTTEKNSTD